MSTNHLLELLIKASRNASRKLYRDFCEIENLQNTSQNMNNFADSSIQRVQEVISDELKAYKITSHFTFSLNENLDHDIYIRILPLDSPKLFKRARNAFGTLLILYQKGEPTIFVINFPAMKQILYGSNEDGLYLESLSRNIVEQLNKKTSAKIVGHLGTIHAGLYDIKTLKDVEDVLTNSHTEIINSPLYLLYLMCSGKIDLAILPDNVFYRDIASILVNIPDSNISTRVERGVLWIFNTSLKI